jgi:hypothetical protein
MKRVKEKRSLLYTPNAYQWWSLKPFSSEKHGRYLAGAIRRAPAKPIRRT